MSDVREDQKTVLVVEDESLLRMLTVEMLEDAGFSVIQAETADEGARLLDEAHEIVGLMTDVETPGALDGLGLARITHDTHPGVAILVVSGRVQVGDRDLPPKSRFIPKPYSGAVVLKAFREMLP